MTQREFVLKMEPGAENKSCYGGIRYCPHAYRDILPVPLEMCSVPLEMCSGTSKASAELCEKCWNQEMVLPAPAKKPMAQVNAFMNQDADEKPAENAVDHPQHYNQGSIECIDALNAMVEGWFDPGIGGIGVADSQVHLAASVQGKAGGRPQKSTVLP